jgi:hypothetical protein
VLTLTPASQVHDVATSFSIDLHIENPGATSLFTTSIAYDASKLRFVSGALNDSIFTGGDFDDEPREDVPGVILLGGRTENPLGSSVSLATLSFEGILPGIGTAEVLLSQTTVQDKAFNAVDFDATPARAIIGGEAPYVIAIRRAGSAAATTNATQVVFEVEFSEPVTGPAAGDFAVLAGGGITGAAVLSISGADQIREVTVDAGAGEGTLALALVDQDTILDAVNNPLGGPGAGNGDFTSAPLFTIDRTAPMAVLSSSSPTAVAGVAVVVTAQLSEVPAGLTAADLQTNGAVLDLVITGTTAEFTVSLAAAGTLSVQLPAGVFSDAAGNPSTASNELSITVTGNQDIWSVF